MKGEMGDHIHQETVCFKKTKLWAMKAPFTVRLCHSHPMPRGLTDAMLELHFIRTIYPKSMTRKAFKTKHQMPEFVFHCMHCYLNNTHWLRPGLIRRALDSNNT